MELPRLALILIAGLLRDLDGPAGGRLLLVLGPRTDNSDDFSPVPSDLYFDNTGIQADPPFFSPILMGPFRWWI